MGAPGTPDQKPENTGILARLRRNLFFEKGADATSVADIASHAGCSVGSVYHHFRDKKALLYALHDPDDRPIQKSAGRAVDPARREGESITDILAAILNLRSNSNEHGRASSVQDLKLLITTHHCVKISPDLQADYYQGLHRLLSQRSAEVRHPDPDFACGFVLDQITAMMRSRGDPLFRKTQVSPCSDRQFMIELIRSACAYLQIPMPNETDLPQLREFRS